MENKRILEREYSGQIWEVRFVFRGEDTPNSVTGNVAPGITLFLTSPPKDLPGIAHLQTSSPPTYPHLMICCVGEARRARRQKKDINANRGLSRHDTVPPPRHQRQHDDD